MRPELIKPTEERANFVWFPTMSKDVSIRISEVNCRSVFPPTFQKKNCC